MPRQKNFYNYGPKKSRSTSDPENDHVPDDGYPDRIEDLMMPGNYTGRNHRSRKMPLRQPRLKP